MKKAAIARAGAIGVAVNGHPERVGAALPELAELLAVAVGDPDTALAVEVIQSLGLAWDARATALLLPLAQAGHHDGEVRLALARSLPHADNDPVLRDQVIDVLIGMTNDQVPRVRDWACFGLNLLEADSDTARAAYAARLDDDDVDAASEALVGLARLRDPRALHAVIEHLTGDQDDIWLPQLTAAELLADPALTPALQTLQAAWEDDDDDHTVALARALVTCLHRPRVISNLAAVQADLRATLYADATLDLEPSHDGASSLLVAHGGYSQNLVGAWVEEPSSADRTVALAALVQRSAVLFDEPDPPWPPCRIHPDRQGHGLIPTTVSGQPYWTCSDSGKQTPIGNLS